MRTWLKKTAFLLGVLLLSEITVAQEENKASQQNNKYGYSINLGNSNGSNDDFEWYMPLHIGPPENWTEPKKEGGIIYRSLKPGKRGFIYAKPIPENGNQKPSFVEIKYKNSANTPISLKMWSGIKNEDGYEILRELKGGKTDNEWTTECIELPMEKLKINEDGFYTFAIDLGNINTELPVSELKVFIKTPGNGKIYVASEKDKLGFEDKLSWNLTCYPPKIKDYEAKLDKQTYRSGKYSLMIKCLKKDEATSWGGAFYDIKVKEETNYKLTVYAKAQDVNGAGLMCYYNGVKPKTIDSYKFDNGTYDWTKYEFRLRTPKGNKSIRCYFRVGGKGIIWFDDIKIEEIPAEKAQMLVHAGKTYLYDPRAEKQDTPLSADVLKKYSSKSCIPYIRKNLRGFYPDSVPQPDEVKETVSAFACPGQYATGWFMVYGLEDIKGLTVSIAENLSCKNNVIRKEDIQIKYIRCWETPYSQFYNSYRYFIIPELLEKNRAINISKNTSAAFWIQLKVPDPITPGDYNSKLLVKSGDKILSEIDLKIGVLPFKLEQPEGINWQVVSDLNSRYKDKNHQYTDEELLRYLSDMKDYGITSIFDMSYGNLDYTRRTARLFKKTGFKGPLIIHSFAEAKVKAKHNIKGATRSSFPEMNDPAFQQEVIEEIKQMDAIIREEGVTDWYYHGFGETNDYQPEWLKHAIFSSQMATKAGVKLFTTLYPIEIIKILFPYIKDGINVSAFFASDPEKNAIYHKLAKENNISLWGVSGIYTGQTGGMMPNRYNTGFLMYKTGGQGHETWTYQRVESKGGPNPWNRILCMAYPAPEISEKEVSISTLQWEGVREGIDDYKYLYTLEQWIKKAKKKGFIKEAQEAEKKLDKIVKEMPWTGDFVIGNSYLKPGNFTEDDAMKCRWKIANLIIELKNYIEKEKTMFPTYKDIQTNPGIGERGMIDIYLPGDKVPYPFILGIHGGGWCGGDRASYRHFWPRVRQRGFALVLCSYRLAPEFHYPNQFDDLMNVLKWLKTEGRKYGLDTERCALLGGSAGGHMLMLSGLRATKEIPDEIVKIKALIDYCGVMNVKDQYFYDTTVRHSQMTSNFIGGTPEGQDDKYREASPVNHVHKLAPPVWMAHGEKDNVVPIGQSEKMAAALKEKGVECVLMRAPGRGHTLTKEDDFKIGDVQFLYEEEMFSFLEEKLK